MLFDEDVPSPINLNLLEDARFWAEEANSKRPWRYAFFQYYSEIIQQYDCTHILDIGSGPGFIAEYLLSQNKQIKQYTALDCSLVMHDLAKQQVHSEDLARIKFIVSNFKHDDWAHKLNFKKFDFIVIHQALHELRHKKYAEKLHRQVKKLLNPQGIYLICDHLFANDAMQNNQLYMSKQEHLVALKEARFNHIIQPLAFNGLCLFQCQI